MKRNSPLFRTLAIFLSLATGLTSPAFALRNAQPVNSGVEENLQEILRAGTEEVVKHHRGWQRTQEKIIQALRAHPGGSLKPKTWARLAGVSSGTLEYHGYRQLVIAENKHRAELTPPLRAVVLWVQKRPSNPKILIRRALRAHPGGRLLLKELEELAGISDVTIRKYLYLVEKENEHRAKLKPLRPAIVMLGRERGAEASIRNALRAYSGGLLTARQLSKLAGVSTTTLRVHAYLKLVAEENARRRDSTPLLPEIVIFNPLLHSRVSSAGVEEIEVLHEYRESELGRVLPDLLDLKEIFQEEVFGVPSTSDAFRSMVLRDRTKKEVLVVSRELSSGRVVGYALAERYPVDVSTAEISQLVVHPDFRNQGRGRRLFEKALNEIKNLPGPRITRVIVMPDSADMVKWATEFGFVREGNTNRYVLDLPPAAGTEEKYAADVVKLLDEAMPDEPGVLVIEAEEISRRVGLAEFMARVPRRLGNRIILFGKESAEAREIAARNGITVVESDKLSDLVFQLMLLGEEADRVGYVGNPQSADVLSGLLPSSMEFTPLDPAVTLDKLLLFLGYPRAVLDVINAAGAEELFAQARAA